MSMRWCDERGIRRAGKITCSRWPLAYNGLGYKAQLTRRPENFFQLTDRLKSVFCSFMTSTCSLAEPIVSPPGTKPDTGETGKQPDDEPD
jgi:hypothetical protein